MRRWIVAAGLVCLLSQTAGAAEPYRLSSGLAVGGPFTRPALTFAEYEMPGRYALHLTVEQQEVARVADALATIVGVRRYMQAERTRAFFEGAVVHLDQGGGSGGMGVMLAAGGQHRWGQVAVEAWGGPLLSPVAFGVQWMAGVGLRYVWSETSVETYTAERTEDRLAHYLWQQQVRDHPEVVVEEARIVDRDRRGEPVVSVTIRNLTFERLRRVQVRLVGYDDQGEIVRFRDLGSPYYDITIARREIPAANFDTGESFQGSFRYTIYGFGNAERFTATVLRAHFADGSVWTPSATP